MVDLNHDIDELLNDIAPVQLQFPDTSQSFPLITLFGVDNSSNLILDGAERLSSIVLQLDAWDTSKNGNTRQRCNELAADVSARMIGRGWRRDQGREMRDPSGLHRYMMQFSGVVDNVTGAIYQKSRF
ncbi:hypothetical protein SAMN02745823_03892 [Sporobacter termitidis DSM 10068]|uniref:Uncharacterized protein n=1 Tax=Sporobacter termitidis DSM 10068 TaxID=1123282 RepID=A0A1M5ZL34_9FIRM|nr:hypothetical protein [Sporobacter termitidis]SHI25017.1 hypothetical protein SAMN02745823_03892 [Sporobacter termitidis DSM 10068]